MAVATYSLASGSTWKAAAITDATDFSFSESSTPTRLSTDGSKTVNLIVVDQKVATITVNGVNTNLMANANFRAGQTGSLVLKAKLRTAGDGVSTAQTFTFAEAVLISITPTTPNDGNSTLQVTFEAYDSDESTASLVALS